MKIGVAVFLFVLITLHSMAYLGFPDIGIRPLTQDSKTRWYHYIIIEPIIFILALMITAILLCSVVLLLLFIALLVVIVFL